MTVKKVALTKNGKTIEFPVGQVAYMISHGWKKEGAASAETEVETDSETKPPEAKSSSNKQKSKTTQT